MAKKEKEVGVPGTVAGLQSPWPQADVVGHLLRPECCGGRVQALEGCQARKARQGSCPFHKSRRDTRNSVLWWMMSQLRVYGSGLEDRQMWAALCSVSATDLPIGKK